MYGYQSEPAKIDPIIKPGAPWWAGAMGTPTTLSRRTLAAAAAAVVLLSTVGLFLIWVAILLNAWWLLAFGAIGGFGALLAAYRSSGRYIIAAPEYTFEGVPIEGASLDLLADIQNRFDWAEKMFGEVPSGIRWDDVKDDVAVLMWEAAEHAAKISAFEVELIPLSYGDPGSPQAALSGELSRRRDEHHGHLVDIQREAFELAREASNAATAARIALSRTGSVYDMQLVSPTGAGLAARGTLAAARARLILLAEVWSELDETGLLADEKFRAQLEAGNARPPRRNLASRRADAARRSRPGGGSQR